LADIPRKGERVEKTCGAGSTEKKADPAEEGHQEFWEPSTTEETKKRRPGATGSFFCFFGGGEKNTGFTRLKLPEKTIGEGRKEENEGATNNNGGGKKDLSLAGGGGGARPVRPREMGGVESFFAKKEKPFRGGVRQGGKYDTKSG